MAKRLNFYKKQLKQKKAQALVEFLIIIAILLVFLFMYVQPAIKYSQDLVLDIMKVKMLEMQKDSLVHFLNNVSSFAGIAKAKKSIFLFTDSAISCNNNKLKIAVTLYDGTFLSKDFNLLAANCNFDFNTFGRQTLSIYYCDLNIDKNSTGVYLYGSCT